MVEKSLLKEVLDEVSDHHESYLHIMRQNYNKVYVFIQSS